MIYYNQELVKEFHAKFGLTINSSPTIPNDKDAALRINLIMEEMGELLEALLERKTPFLLSCSHNPSTSVIGIADACADLDYVISGAGVTYGLELNPSEDAIEAFNFGEKQFLNDYETLSAKECIMPQIARKGMEACRLFSEATVKKDFVALETSLNNLLNYTIAVARGAGIKHDVVFTEVHRSNLSKVWEDGSVRRREGDGKIMKPPTYSPADIEGVLKKQ